MARNAALENSAITDRQREGLLRRRLESYPADPRAQLDMAILLFGQRRNAEALPHFEFLVQHAPQMALFRASLAVCLADIGDYKPAIQLYEECREAFKNDVPFQLNYAEALKYAGRRDESVAVLRGVLEKAPESGSAWWALANSKIDLFSHADIEIMLRQVNNASVNKQEKCHLHYALGKALEQHADFEASFIHYSRGAALKRAEISFDDSNAVPMAERMKRFFTAERLAARSGCSDPAPIFILGMPRAGSTLVEQILASHSMVEGTMELPVISYIVRDLDWMNADCRYPEIMSLLNDDALAALGERYIENTRLYRKTSKPYFTDKMPANWAHVGLIHMILPNAKIIDVRREPMANCFAVFKQLFGRGVEYSYDFRDLARYYRSYADRMQHFDEVLPGRMHHVQYEKLVEDTETEIRRLLKYCGLEFEPACMRFWESDRAVATPSADQVRRPIFRDGLHTWRNYEPFLSPLKQFLSGPTGK